MTDKAISKAPRGAATRGGPIRAPRLRSQVTPPFQERTPAMTSEQILQWAPALCTFAACVIIVVLPRLRGRR